jgi:DNA polymerase III gamma/tau subunit
LVTDLLEHLRHLLLVQHMGDAPESLPVTDETRERLRSQANQVGEPTVLRLCDLLAVAVDDMRQGGDPRLPLELALVKVTRPGADLSHESLAYRLDQLEQRGHAPPEAPARQPSTNLKGSDPSREVESSAPTSAEPPALELEQLQDVWQRSILPAVEQRSIPAASVFREARPAGLSEDVLRIEFPPEADFHRKMAEEPKNSNLLADALYEVTGRKLGVAFAVGERAEVSEEEHPPANEEDFVELVKQTFDAREIEEP